MKQLAMTMCVAFGMLAMSAAQTGEKQQPGGPGPEVEQLDWLAGQWRGTFEDGHWEASYTTAESGLVLSSNKEIKNGRVAMFEFEHFFVRDGKVMMSPHPNGRKSKTEFEMVECDKTKRRAVFTADNDFPAKIIYHRVEDDRLVIDLFAKDAPADAAPMRLDLKKR